MNPFKLNKIGESMVLEFTYSKVLNVQRGFGGKELENTIQSKIRNIFKLRMK